MSVGLCEGCFCADKTNKVHGLFRARDVFIYNSKHAANFSKTRFVTVVPKEVQPEFSDRINPRLTA